MMAYWYVACWSLSRCDRIEVGGEDAMVDDEGAGAIYWIGGRHMRRSPWSLMMKATTPM